VSDKTKKFLAARILRFDGDYLFPHNDIDGNKPTGSLVYINLKMTRAPGFNFRIYDARHIFATRAIKDGGDSRNSNLKMWMRYAHPSERRKAAAIRKMEKGQAKQSKGCIIKIHRNSVRINAVDK